MKPILSILSIVILLPAIIIAGPRHKKAEKEVYFEGPPKERKHINKKKSAEIAKVTVGAIGNVIIEGVKEERKGK